jgi:hypothetical protein
MGARPDGTGLAGTHSLAWAEVPFVHVPTKVRYFTAAEGGVSQWRAFQDNWPIAKMHTHVCLRRRLVLPR